MHSRQKFNILIFRIINNYNSIKNLQHENMTARIKRRYIYFDKT